MPNVFDWLDEVRARPGMYVLNSSLRSLEALVLGYCTALRVHGIIESVPSMDRHFLSWLQYATGWSCNCGWAFAIDEHHPKPEEAFAVFFSLVDEYRRLQPTRICSVRLGARHNPTGKRVVCGFGGRLRKPRRVDVIRYRPAPLHFLRLHYPDHIANFDLLMTGTGDFATIRYAKQWVRDELQVKFAEWKSALH